MVLFSLLGSFGPLWSHSYYLVLFGLLWSYSVHFDPIRSIRPHWSYSVCIGPFRSTLVLFGPIGLFGLIQSILSALVLFGPADLIQSNLVLLGPSKFFSVLFGPPRSYKVHSVLFGPEQIVILCLCFYIVGSISSDAKYMPKLFSLFESLFFYRKLSLKKHRVTNSRCKITKDRK